METIERYLNLTDCRSESQWAALVREHCAEFGFERYSVCISSSHCALGHSPGVLFSSNYPEKWLENYRSKKYALVDPIAAHCLCSNMELFWSPELFSGAKLKKLYEESCRHGLRAGVTLPMHGPNGEAGMLSLASGDHPDEQFRSHVQRRLPALSLLRDCLFESGLRLLHQRETQDENVSLTHRELECLKWCADGKSSWDIANLLNCTVASVNFHFLNIRKKFRTSSRHHAVIKAVNLGLISLDDSSPDESVD